MPQIASLHNLRSKNSPTQSIPVSISDSSNIIMQNLQGDNYVPYRIFSRSPYQNFLYRFGQPEALFPTLNKTLLSTFNKISNLLSLPDGWNGYDGSAPEYGAIEYAQCWISLLHRKVISLAQQWCAPNVTASGEGEVVFEWWQGSKKLTVYVGNQSAEYLKVWGPDIDTDMEDGQAESPEMLGLLWKWLMS